MNITVLDNMENAFTATILLKNGQAINIWYTCWPSIRSITKSVINVSSDYPKRKNRWRIQTQ